MSPTALVVTTVHWPDDTRIRERLIRSLADDFEVHYAAKVPGPADPGGLVSIPLRGGRLARNLRVLTLVLKGGWDVVVVHDLELVPAAVVARLVRRIPVVFDVHEDYAALARTRGWVAEWLRAPISWLAGVMMKTAERVLTITLAEPGYQRLFTRSHPVFPNYPDTSRYPESVRERRDEAVYLGDVTRARGVDLAIEACSRAGVSLRLIGRVGPDMESILAAGFDRMLVEGPLPNPEAIARVRGARVGLAPLHDLPNYRHSQPTKVLEYLALGIPVVASDLPGTRQLLEGLEAVWLVEPGDLEAFTRAIGEARSDSAVDTAIDQSTKVRERFGWPVEEVRSFYGSLIAG